MPFEPGEGSGDKNELKACAGGAGWCWALQSAVHRGRAGQRAQPSISAPQDGQVFFPGPSCCSTNRALPSDTCHCPPSAAPPPNRVLAPPQALVLQDLKTEDPSQPGGFARRRVERGSVVLVRGADDSGVTVTWVAWVRRVRTAGCAHCQPQRC